MPDTPAPHPHKQRTGLNRLWHATGYSLAGLRAGWREKAFRQEVLLAAVLLLSIAACEAAPARILPDSTADSMTVAPVLLETTWTRLKADITTAEVPE